jgi:hypothetical protein
MKRILTILALVVLVLGGLSLPAFSADTGVVSVTAEVAQVLVSVSPGNVNYGLVPLNTVRLKPIGDHVILAINTDNCFVNIQIKGTDTTDWALSPSPDVDKYVHYFSWPFISTTYTPLNAGYQEVKV